MEPSTGRPAGTVGMHCPVLKCNVMAGQVACQIGAGRQARKRTGLKARRTGQPPPTGEA